MAAFIKEQNRYIDRIDSSAIMDLPAGIQSKSGTLDYTIIIKRLVTTPDSGAFLEVCMSFEIPQNGRKIAFVGRHIPFSFSGGIKGDSRIVVKSNNNNDSTIFAAITVHVLDKKEILTNFYYSSTNFTATKQSIEDGAKYLYKSIVVTGSTDIQKSPESQWEKVK